MALILTYCNEHGLIVDNAYWVIKLSLNEDLHKGAQLYFTAYSSKLNKNKGSIDRYTITVPIESSYYITYLTDESISALGGRPRNIAYQLVKQLTGVYKPGDPFTSLTGIDFTKATDDIN